MLKFLILTCLIIKTHSWTWNDYPSPRGTTYWKCGLTKPAWICDPDGMLTDQQRKEIVELVEDFKEKTKRPNSIYSCMREGLRLVVALAKDKIGPEDTSSGKTNLCRNNRRWISLDETNCKTDMIGIELNTNVFRFCYQLRPVMTINYDEFRQLNNNEGYYLNYNNYFEALKWYIESLRILYIHRLSIFDDDASISEIQQALDLGNKTLSNSQAAIEENKLKLSEMRELLTQGQKLYEKNTVSQQFFNYL
uniref:Uncharacterized protein n=1 Tax=Meloidogyne incognita TaxID=6306 RepID=A0A914LGF4_MELIC